MKCSRMMSKASAKRNALHAPVVLLMLGLSLTSLQGASDDKNDWPGWRGQNADATVNDAGVFEDGQTYRLQVKWQENLGSGYSSVSIQDDVAVTLFSDSTYDFAIALSTENGEELWRFKIDSTHAGRNGSQSGPLSTPLIADRKVFGLGPNGQLFALDLMTGEQLWACELVREHDAVEPFYGFATSPVLYKNTIVVETGGQKQNAITAFDKNTGERLWAAADDKVLYQSPVITNLRDRPNLLCVGSRFLYGLVPESGVTLWQYAHKGQGGWAYGGANMSPVILPDNKIFLTYKHLESVLLQVKTVDNQTVVEDVWRTKEIKKNYTDPVYYDGYLYGYSGAFLACIDAGTGERVWKSRQPGDGSLIVVDGHLVLTTKHGTLNIAKATPAGYTELASLELFDELCWSAPSFASGKIYARSHGEIACVEIVPSDQIAGSIVEKEKVIPSGSFVGFIERVNVANNKAALIDEFMAPNKQTPLIDKDGMVHFWYHGEAEEIALIGDISGFDMELPMNRVKDTDFFYYSMPLEPDARVGYMFLKNEEHRVVDPSNRNRAVTIFFGIPYELSLVTMPRWVEPKHLYARKDIVPGRIDSVLFKSAISDSIRTLEVYIPSGYDSNTDRHPVTYVHTTIGSSKIRTTLDNLIGNSIEPTVVVFIPSLLKTRYWQRYWECVTENRDTYARIFVDEIIPLIDRKYRTRPSGRWRANYGTFYGGFMAFYTTFKYPDMFGKLGLQTPYWDPDEEKKHSALISSSETKTLDIYLDWGKYDFRNAIEGWDFGAYAKSFGQLLKQEGFDFQGGEVNEGFGWKSWSNRTDLVFETFFPLDDPVKTSSGTSQVEKQ